MHLHSAPLFLLSFLIFLILLTQSSALVAAASSSSPSSFHPDAATIDFALAELNRIATRTPISNTNTNKSATSSSSSTSSSPFLLYSLTSVSSTLSHGEILFLKPVYRTVRGYDEKKRKPVLYKTLVQEQHSKVIVVDESVKMHVTVQRRQNGDEQQQQKQRSECIDTSTGCLDFSSSSTLLHTILTVSIDASGSRALTMLRSANCEEVENWWKDWMSENEGRKDETMMKEQVERCRTEQRTINRVLIDTATADEVASSSSSSSASLRIMCVNLWNYNHWTPRIPLISSILHTEQPTLIGFQEVRAVKHGPGTGQGRWQVSDLHTMLPEYEFFYQPSMGFREGPVGAKQDFVHEGLAIFSARPIHETDLLRLSRDEQDGEDFHQRSVVRTKVRISAASSGEPAQYVNMLTTHLSLSLQARTRTLPEVARHIEKLNAKQAEEARAASASSSSSTLTSTSSTTPSILVGDFNSIYSQGPHILIENHGFKDAWSSLYGLSEESDRQGWTFNSWQKKSRIDFVVWRNWNEETQDDLSSTPAATSSSLSLSSIRVVGSEGVSVAGQNLAGMGGVGDLNNMLYPSDHMFLSAEFKLETKKKEEKRHDKAAASGTENDMPARDEL